MTEYDYAPNCPDCGTKMKPSFTEFFCERIDQHILPVDDDWDDQGTLPGGWGLSAGDTCDCGKATLQPFSAQGFGVTAHCPACGRCY